MKAIDYISHQLAEKIKKEAELMELVHQQNQTIDQLLAERQALADDKQNLTSKVAELEALLDEQTQPNNQEEKEDE